MIGNFLSPSIEFKHLDIASCFGITPIFVNPDGSVDCNLFNLYRKYDTRILKSCQVIKEIEKLPAEVRHIWHHKTDKEKQEIVNNAIDYYSLPARCVEMMRSLAVYYDFDITMDQFLQQGRKYVNDKILIASLMIFCYGRMTQGNRIISSDKRLLDMASMGVSHMGNHKKILLPETLLPRNEILITGAGRMSFNNGMLLCPILYRNEFNKWMFENNRTDDFSDQKFVRYQIMRQYAKKYEVYQDYINEYIPMRWHIEVFEKNAKCFYNILRFKKAS